MYCCLCCFSYRKFYGRHHDLVNHYGTFVSHWPRICPTCRKHFPVHSSLMTLWPKVNGQKDKQRSTKHIIKN